MRLWRFPLAPASTWLIVIGVLISAAAATGAIVDTRQRAAADQGDSAAGSNQDFVPLVMPVGPLEAPTLPASLPEVSGGRPTALASAFPTATDEANRSALSQPTAETATGMAAVTTRPAAPPTPVPVWNPDRIVIPAIKLDAPTVPAEIQSFQVQGQLVREWVAPNTFAAGWLTASVPLGVPGNTVIVGHHNLDGEVFGHLVDLKAGDVILMYAGGTEFAYKVALTLILPERFEPLSVRLSNARWIEPSTDERLTLVTCWPYASNTHRLIVVATPISLSELPYDTAIPRLTPHPALDWQSTPTTAP
jgi:LPXTG-site transpeptidase (sortase) family protein